MAPRRGAQYQIHQAADGAEILQVLDRVDHRRDIGIRQHAARIGAEFLRDLSARQRVLE